MSINEAIAKYKEITNTDANCPAHCNISCDKCVQESEQLAEWLEELKAIKDMDLDIPQHFTKEQSVWIKAYCIKRNIEFYNKALDDFTEKIINSIDGEFMYQFKYFPAITMREIAERLKVGVKE